MTINQSTYDLGGLSPGDFVLPAASPTSNTNTSLLHLPPRSGRHDQQGGNSSRGNREVNFTRHPKEIIQLEKSGAACHQRHIGYNPIGHR